MNAAAALALLREVPLERLCDLNGCICTSCAIQGIEIDVSCRKRSGTSRDDGPTTMIRVHSRHLDADAGGLAMVAQEVVRQVHRWEPWPHIVVRFCDYAQDNPPKCIYCGKSRNDMAGYLCDACLDNPDALYLDYRTISLDIPVPECGK